MLVTHDVITFLSITCKRMGKKEHGGRVKYTRHTELKRTVGQKDVENSCCSSFLIVLMYVVEVVFVRSENDFKSDHRWTPCGTLSYALYMYHECGRTKPMCDWLWIPLQPYPRLRETDCCRIWNVINIAGENCTLKLFRIIMFLREQNGCATNDESGSLLCLELWKAEQCTTNTRSRFSSVRPKDLMLCRFVASGPTWPTVTQP